MGSEHNASSGRDAPVYGRAPRVVFDDGSGPVLGRVPADRRCSGCRGYATHCYDTAVNAWRRSTRSRPYIVCADCVRFWKANGITGRVTPIEARHG